MQTHKKIQNCRPPQIESLESRRLCSSIAGAVVTHSFIAQPAPDFISGDTFTMTVTNGSDLFGTGPVYQLLFAPNGSSVVTVLTSAGEAKASGTYDWFPGPVTSSFNITNNTSDFGGPLNFATATTGTFRLTGVVGAADGFENGTFVLSMPGTTPTPTPTPTPMGSSLDAMNVQADLAKLSSDLASFHSTTAADAAAARSTVASDRLVISSDRSRLIVDRHSPQSLAADRQQLASDVRKLHADASAGTLKLRQDSSAYMSARRTGTSQLLIDRIQLHRDRIAGR